MRIAEIKALVIAPLLLTTSVQGLFAQETVAPSMMSPDRIETVTFSEEKEQVLLVEITIAEGGTYTLSVPAAHRVAVRLDGVKIINAPDPASDPAAEMTALVSLTPGPHQVELIGRGLSADVAEAVSLKRVGLPVAVSLASLSSTLPVFVSPSQDMAALMETDTMNNIQSQVIAATRSSQAASSAPTFEGVRAAQDIRNVINDALAIVDPTLPPPPPPNGGAASSPLGPPLNVTLTQAVEIIGGSLANDKLAATGQTLFGRVMDPITYNIVNATIEPSGRQTTVEVGPSRGGFAIRLFEEDLTSGAVTVTVSAGSSDDPDLATLPVSYDYTTAAVTDGVGLALSRTTFGATADLYARIRAIGYRAYVEEQLSPETIDDSRFERMNFGQLLNRDTNGAGSAAVSLQYHNFATATYSQKQLQEVMGLFWSNHLHAANKMSPVITQAFDDRQFYRENAMGRFEDLLLYSARSPLMSQFLDNDQSRVGEINENYGREILELHTVGVDAGYGDEDVIAVSRIFTGWNFRRTNPNTTGREALFEFEFKPDDHDSEDKYIPFLDVTIQGRSGPAGVEEGEELIALLAQDPRTHEFVCRKIVQWFVSDTPPANFVQICVDAWAASDGSSREILRAILLAPEFITTPQIIRSKGKNPLEYGASVMRAAGTLPDDPANSNLWYWFGYPARNAGYSPAEFPVPTGLPEFGKAWANTSAFVAEYNAGYIMFANRNNFNVLPQEDLIENGLETAEEVAAYILAIGTADLYRQDEFDAVVEALKGEDGLFRLHHRSIDVALGRGITMLTVLPSFHLQ